MSTGIKFIAINLTAIKDKKIRQYWGRRKSLQVNTRPPPEILTIRNIFQSIRFPVKKVSTTTKEEHTEPGNIYFTTFDNNSIHLKAAALWLKTKSNSYPLREEVWEGKRKKTRGRTPRSAWLSLTAQVSISRCKCVDLCKEWFKENNARTRCVTLLSSPWSCTLLATRGHTQGFSKAPDPICSYFPS